MCLTSLFRCISLRLSLHNTHKHTSVIMFGSLSDGIKYISHLITSLMKIRLQYNNVVFRVHLGTLLTFRECFIIYLWCNVDYNIRFDQYKLISWFLKQTKILFTGMQSKNIASRLKCKIVFKQETNEVKLLNNIICVKLYPFRTGQYGQKYYHDISILYNIDIYCDIHLLFMGREIPHVWKKF